MNSNYYHQTPLCVNENETKQTKRPQQDVDQIQSRNLLTSGQLNSQPSKSVSPGPGGLSAVQMRVKAMEEQKQQLLTNERERAKTPTFSNRVQQPVPSPQQNLQNKSPKNEQTQYKISVEQPANDKSLLHPDNKPDEERIITINERIAALQKKSEQTQSYNPKNQVLRNSRTPNPFKPQGVMHATVPIVFDNQINKHQDIHQHRFNNQNVQINQQVTKPNETNNHVIADNNQQDQIPSSNVKLIQQRMQQQQQQQQTQQFQPKQFKHQVDHRQNKNQLEVQQESIMNRPSVTPDPRIDKSSNLVNRFDQNFLKTLNTVISQGPKPKGLAPTNMTKGNINIHGNQDVSYEHLNKDMVKISQQLNSMFTQDPTKRPQAPTLDQKEDLKHDNLDRVKQQKRQQQQRAQHFDDS